MDKFVIEEMEQNMVHTKWMDKWKQEAVIAYATMELYAPDKDQLPYKLKFRMYNI